MTNLTNVNNSYRKDVFLPIVSISTFFKRNIPYGETNILYVNGTRISMHLNELGFYCGSQKYYNKENNLIKVRKMEFDEEMAWVRKYNYFILVKNDELTNILSSEGNYYF